MNNEKFKYYQTDKKSIISTTMHLNLKRNPSKTQTHKREQHKNKNTSKM